MHDRTLELFEREPDNTNDRLAGMRSDGTAPLPGQRRSSAEGGSGWS